MADMDYAARARLLNAVREEKDTEIARWLMENTDRRFRQKDGNRGL